MKPFLPLTALLLSSTAYGRVTEHCPAPADITSEDGSYHASGLTPGSRWSGTPSAGDNGDVLDFMDAEFHAVTTNHGVTFGFMEGCTYRLTSGTVLMKYEGGMRLLLPPHGWRAVSRGSWLYKCRRYREICPFTIPH